MDEQSVRKQLVKPLEINKSNQCDIDCFVIGDWNLFEQVEMKKIFNLENLNDSVIRNYVEKTTSNSMIKFNVYRTQLTANVCHSQDFIHYRNLEAHSSTILIQYDYGTIILFELRDNDQFEDAREFIETIRRKYSTQHFMVLVGFHYRYDPRRHKPYEFYSYYARENNCGYLEMSIDSGQNYYEAILLTVLQKLDFTEESEK
ncbi:UNKNOWN [Stylonychia lemnae]|uniref:Uncharacterized protein n=1 Tax=Stylonychia lemnae TaxID=5949 RepID=A0A078AEI3_STYLE|nr:UNKNOWN [Stylonychia lemnae]|eukprot:CDW80256.1 UNKNOWN [Stylonychia lemnae]